MQYLPTQTQSGGIQYLQLIPTRPLIVPYNPYLQSSYNHYNPQIGQYQTAPMQYNGQSNQYAASPYSSSHTNQYNQQPATYNSPANSHTLASAASTYSTYPNSQYHPPTPTHNNYGAYQPTLQSPIGGYSTNVYTYFRPNAGVQLINGPLDLSLNTNEYVPLQGDGTFKMRRPWRWQSNIPADLFDPNFIHKIKTVPLLLYLNKSG